MYLLLVMVFTFKKKKKVIQIENGNNRKILFNLFYLDKKKI